MTSLIANNAGMNHKWIDHPEDMLMEASETDRSTFINEVTFKG